MEFLAWIIIILVVAFFIGVNSENNGKQNLSVDEMLFRKRLLVNKKFEEATNEKIGNSKYRNEILEIIKDDLIYVYGDAWEELFAGTWYQTSLYNCAFSTRENIILTLLLSKNGFVPQHYEFSRFRISNFEYANAYECLKILQCVEKNIKAKRTETPDLNLLFTPEVSFETKKKSCTLVPNYNYPCSGEFAWGFESYYPQFTVSLYNENLIHNCKEASIGPRSLRTNPYKDKLLS